MLYEMQVVRTSQQDCVTKPVLVGRPVNVFADCLEEAKQKAATEKLLVRHEHQSYYHTWLVSQRKGIDLGEAKFNPNYSWAFTTPQLTS